MRAAELLTYYGTLVVVGMVGAGLGAAVIALCGWVRAELRLRKVYGWRKAGD